MSSNVRNRLLLVAAAALFSTGGAAIKMAALTDWQVASFRSGVAAAVLLAALPEARRTWSWRLAPVAVPYAATLLLFVMATRLTTAANAIFLQSTAPLYVLLLGPLVLREHVRRSDAAYMAAIAVGMACFFWNPQPALQTAPDPSRGNALAAAAGLAWALTLTGLRWIGRERDGRSLIAAVAAGNLLAFLAALPMALTPAPSGARNIAIVLYLGAVQIGLAYVLVSRAIRHLPAFEATMLLLVEPVLNPIWVWLVHGERPGALALAGGGIILLATAANTWAKGHGEGRRRPEAAV
jgi:drug/metabolite transporter (DMT)-like permease